MNATKQAQLNAMAANGYLGWVESWVRACCAPLYYRDAEGKQHNGSMTFVDTGQAILGLTAGHVADEVVRHCDGSPGRKCQVGSTELPASNLAARHRRLDLATFRVSSQFLAAAGHFAAGVSTWPPPRAMERELLLFAGYPALYRQDLVDRFDVGLLWFVWLAQSVSAESLGMPLGIRSSLTASDERVPENADLGGWSGGAVFRVIEERSQTLFRARLELVGIIHEYSSIYEIVLAHHLSAISITGACP